MPLPAREFEACVKHQLAQRFDDPLSLAARLALEISPFLLRQITDGCQAVAAHLRGPAHELLRELVDQVRV